MAATRQLAAIMFTDIVGYTALMGDNEQKAFDVLHKNRLLQKPLITQYKGTWIKELGDGVLASFNTATDAVVCAVKIQKACKETDFQLRIGIHLGEVVFEDNDVFGDGVNIAARLQALAPVGGIWISEAVQKNIANKKGIETQFACEETLKHVKEPVRIYEVTGENMEGEQFKQQYLQEEPTTHLPKKKWIVTNEKMPVIHNIRVKEKRPASFKYGIIISSILLIAVTGFLLIPRWFKIREARNKLIPQIQQLADASFLPPTRAFDLAKEAEKYVPNDSSLLRLWPIISQPYSLQTDPAGADVFWKDYNDIDGEWKFIGKTPLKDALVPRGFPRIKIEKQGFKIIYCPLLRNLLNPILKLDSIDKYSERMVKVNSSKAPMLIVGLEQFAGKYVSNFLIDKYEVTNKEYKRFVDAGGYKAKKYWDYPFYTTEKEISWEAAMALFHDKTGRPGPADWEVQSYVDGKENYPVGGISWYEAMAYAKFIGKTLPTVFHWSLIANTFSTWEIIPRSNFNGKGTVPVGSLDNINSWGVYDVGGNIREWCYNETDKKGWHYILGGGWNDPDYAYNDAFSQHALDRSLSNGFRCMKLLEGDTTYNTSALPLHLDFRDYKNEKYVDDKEFKIFLRQYSYDKTPLNVTASSTAKMHLCKIEKIDLDAAYNKERLTVYLFLPNNIKPPYQTIVHFPGSGAIVARKFDFDEQLRLIDFLIKSGRAFCFPVLKGTFERGDNLRSDLQNETIFYKEHVIMWEQDISRALDYLDTRNDIIHDNYGYYSISWGSAMAPIMCAVEKRLKVAVLNVGGLMMQQTLPEVDPLNFLPHVKIPVLMLNGKNDTFYPIETSLKPMFQIVGTNEKDKKMVVYEGGHLVPRSELAKESLLWFDKYLGAVK